jgi:hypothetical protein
MLDVHPPHHAATTWRDFLIHMTTIVLGLLIAISLEQTVEWLHHRHQRHQLEQDLRAESLRNLHTALANIDYLEERAAAGRTQYVSLLRAAHDHTAPVLQRPSPTTLYYAKPAYAVWTVAQQGAMLDLLPRDVAQRYVRVYSLAQIASDIETVNAAGRNRLAARLPATQDAPPAQGIPEPATLQRYDLSLMDPQDLRRYRDAVGSEIVVVNAATSANAYLYGVEWGVLHDLSDQENVRTMYDAAALYTRGGKAAMLAKYPVIEDEQSTPAR